MRKVTLDDDSDEAAADEQHSASNLEIEDYITNSNVVRQSLTGNSGIADRNQVVNYDARIAIT